MHLCPCAQHSAFWLFPSHSYSCTRKKLLQTLHTSGWNAVIEHHCHSAPRHQGCGWHWFFAGLSPKEGNTEIYYSDCWYFSFDLLPVFWQDISSCKKTPFQTLEAHKFPTGHTVTWHPPRTAASQIPSPVLGEAERAGPQLPSPATCALSGITKPSAIQYPCLRCKRTKTLRQLGFFTLHCEYTTRIFSPQAAVTAEQLCTQRATDTWSHGGNVICSSTQNSNTSDPKCFQNNVESWYLLHWIERRNLIQNSYS